MVATAANAINMSTQGLSYFSGSAFSAPSLSQYQVIIGAANNNISGVSPSTAGIPLVSNGASSNPSFSTALVVGGGTGATSFTAYSVICAGTTSTGALQNVSGVGSSGQVLTSNGASSLPSWQALPAGNGFTFVTVASAPTTATDHVYIASAALTVTLPSAPADGYVVGLVNLSSGSVLFQASGSDVIQVGSAVGAAAGSATSAASGDALMLVYSHGAATWVAPWGAQGASWSVA
jgi:hypothetical protein